MKRRYPLSKPGLAAATERLRAYLIAIHRPASAAEDLARDVITRYLHGQRDDDVMTRNWSQTTWLLADMQVGQQAHFTGSSLQLIRQRFPSAKRLAQNPNMVWQCRSLPTGEVQVTRLPDGAPVKRNPLDNPKVAEIADMAVGEEILSNTVTATRGAGYLGSNSKVMARRYIGVQDAQWTVRQEGMRVYIKRIK